MMLDHHADIPETPGHCTADAAQLPAALAGIASGGAAITAPAPHAWDIVCTEFTPPVRRSPTLLGFARFELAGGLRLA
jgi:hypothetical protein